MSRVTVLLSLSITVSILGVCKRLFEPKRVTLSRHSVLWPGSLVLVRHLLSIMVVRRQCRRVQRVLFRTCPTLRASLLPGSLLTQVVVLVLVRVQLPTLRVAVVAQQCVRRLKAGALSTWVNFLAVLLQWWAVQLAQVEQKATLLAQWLSTMLSTLSRVVVLLQCLLRTTDRVQVSTRLLCLALPSTLGLILRTFRAIAVQPFRVQRSSRVSDPTWPSLGVLGQWRRHRLTVSSVSVVLCRQVTRMSSVVVLCLRAVAGDDVMIQRSTVLVRLQSRLPQNSCVRRNRPLGTLACRQPSSVALTLRVRVATILYSRDSTRHPPTASGTGPHTEHKDNKKNGTPGNFTGNPHCGKIAVADSLAEAEGTYAGYFRQAAEYCSHSVAE